MERIAYAISKKKVAWAELKVGVMALVAMILLGILVFLITGSTTLFSDKVTLYTYLSDSAALTKGANVRLNGILIRAASDKVELSGQSTPTRIVRVTMSVDKTFLPSIPTDSQAMIAAENVLGSKYINIKRGMLTDAIQAGTEVKALDTTDFDDVVGKATPCSPPSRACSNASTTSSASLKPAKAPSANSSRTRPL